ncbi:MAG: PrgI family mobile element protein [Bacillota bacterium]
MRQHPVAVQLEDEDKVVGGVMTFRQLIWLIAGFALGGGAAALPLPWYPWYIRALVFGLFFLAGAVLALGRAYGMAMDVFLFRYARWRLRQKAWALKGGA